VARPLRYVPPECPLVEVTCRTIQGRMLLRPSRELNRRVVGVLARAVARYDVGVCAFVFLSNHCHLLLRPSTVHQLSAFMGYVNSNIAREVGRLHHWREKFWGRRYRPVPVSFEPEAQIARLHYVLSQGCKEDLVACPQ
jgi:REP element-mobilizing transposase RayT